MGGKDSPGVLYMPTSGFKYQENMAARQVRRQTVSVINIQTLAEMFSLQRVKFDLGRGEFIAWLRPKNEFAGEAFSAREKIFAEVEEVVYAEENNRVTIRIAQQGLSVCCVEEYVDQEGDDLGDSVCFTAKMHLPRSPRWVNTCPGGALIFRLKNGTEYRISALC